MQRAATNASANTNNASLEAIAIGNKHLKRFLDVETDHY